MGRTSKDRRDIFYRLAKEEGWRARSAFKLLHIDQTFNIFENVTKAVDLCAAPGSWSQVLAHKLPRNEAGTHIVAVDLQTMAPIPGVMCLKGDITRKETADEIIAKLGGHKAQLVVCDGAPDVIGFVPLDQVFQSRLVLAALNIAICVLEPNGIFVSKFFRGNDDNTKSTYMRFRIFFQDVLLTKPRSSRTSSAECFILARGFRLPINYSPGPYFAFNRFDGLVDPELLQRAKLREPTYGEFQPYVPSEALLVPMVLCGDLSGFDSETSYALPEGYKSLPPVQPPIAPAYAEAVARMKAFDRNRDTQYRVKLAGDPNTTTPFPEVIACKMETVDKKLEGLSLNSEFIRKVHLSFGGGADKLVGNIRETVVELKGESSADKYTIGYLLKWIKNNLIVERPELLLSGDDDVRPGILVLVNDMDWELLDDKLNFVISENDKISFISTLHGG